MTRSITGALCACGVLAVVATGQNALWELHAPPADEFGAALAGPGDLDGDGLADVAVGVPGLDRVRMRSGLDGAPLYNTGGEPGSRFGAVLAALGDVDGDGVGDVGVGAPDAPAHSLEPGGGSFFALSGVDGAVLYGDRGWYGDWQLGGLVVALGDVDLDGTPDYGYTYTSSSQLLRAVSGATAEPLAQALLFSSALGPAAAVDGGRDIDGDGIPDFVAAYPGSAPFGSVAAYSGAQFVQGPSSALYHVTFVNQQTTGLDVALVGDLDGDGGSELAVALPLQPDDDPASPGTGRVRLLDSGGHALHDLPGLPAVGERFGVSLAALGDVDGDGRGDLAVGAAYPNGRAGAVSPADGRRLYATLGGGVGAVVSRVGDLDGDGLADLVTSARDPLGLADGRVRAVSGRQGELLAVGEPWASHGGPGPQLHVLGTSSPTGQLALLAANPTAAVGLLMLGLPAAPTALPGGGAVHVAPVLTILPWPMTSPAPAQLALGDTLLGLPAQAVAMQVGLQLFVAGGAGLAASQAVFVEVLD